MFLYIINDGEDGSVLDCDLSLPEPFKIDENNMSFSLEKYAATLEDLSTALIGSSTDLDSVEGNDTIDTIDILVDGADTDDEYALPIGKANEVLA